MKFYRYNSVHYAPFDDNESRLTETIPTIVLEEYNLFKETEKGYWIGYGFLGEGKIRSQAQWVSKTARKRFAYPTKKEALEAFIKRRESRARILETQLASCKIDIKNATNILRILS